MNNPLMYVDEDGEFWWVIVIVYAVLEYGSQVYDNYNRGYDGWDAWFNQVDFFDVAVSAVAGGMSMLFPPAAPAIKYATPLVQNAVDYRPASQWKSIFHSGDRNISLKDWVINSSIDITITYTTSIWKKGMETPKSTSSNVRREIRDVVEEGINDVLQLRLKADINPDNRFHEGKLPQIPPGMQEPIDNRYRRNYEYPHDIDEVFLKAIPDARLFLLYKLR
jgi:hypothetical protein